MLIISADEQKGETLQLLMEILQSRVCMRIQANKVLLTAMQNYRN